MKTLKIGTRAQANKVQVNSLFVPVNGRTLSKARFDRGKYRVDRSFVGHEIEVPENVHALWMERRKDNDGPYQALFCLQGD